MKHKLLVLLAAATLAAPVSAQEFIFGAGYADFSLSRAKDSAAIEVEYHAAPFREYSKLTIGLGGVVSVDGEGDGFVGFGLVNKYAFDERWYGELSLMPGAYFKGPAVNDLGNTLEFRSLLGLGYNIGPRSALSLAILHKSNAGISTVNPGVNSVLLRYHLRF